MFNQCQVRNFLVWEISWVACPPLCLMANTYSSSVFISAISNYNVWFWVSQKILYRVDRGKSLLFAPSSLLHYDNWYAWHWKNANLKESWKPEKVWEKFCVIEKLAISSRLINQRSIVRNNILKIDLKARERDAIKEINKKKFVPKLHRIEASWSTYKNISY